MEVINFQLTIIGKLINEGSKMKFLMLLNLTIALISN